MTKLSVPLCLFAAVALASAGLQAAPDYVASVIEPREEIQSHTLADLNGNGRQDLILGVWSDQGGRELLVYLQGEDGQFPGEPSQRVEIKSDIIAFGVADLRDEPGEELLFLTRNAVYSYSTRKDSYAGNLEKLADWDLLNTVPQTKTLGSLGRLPDLNGDGRPDLLLPGQSAYAVLYGRAEGGFTAPQFLPRPHFDPEQIARGSSRVSIAMEDGLRFVVESPSPFDGLFPDRSGPDEVSRRTLGRFGNRDYIMEVESWLPAVQPANIEGSDRTALVYLDHPESGSEGAARRFNIVHQGAKSKAAWQGVIKSEGQVFVVDFDGDGRDDLLLLEHKGSKESSLLFFRNRDGKFDFAVPDQVLRFSGYEVEAELRDLNGSGRPELIVSYYSLASVDTLRSGSMLRTTLIYPGAKDDLIFARRPVTKIEDRFSADTVKGLTERPHFSADVRGTGRRDMVAVDEQGALTVKAIDDNLQVASQPFWRFVPMHLIHSLIPGSFNNDAHSDFVLLHQNAVTLLVSRHD